MEGSSQPCQHFALNPTVRDFDPDPGVASLLKAHDANVGAATLCLSSKEYNVPFCLHVRVVVAVVCCPPPKKRLRNIIGGDPGPVRECRGRRLSKGGDLKTMSSSSGALLVQKPRVSSSLCHTNTGRCGLPGSKSYPECSIRSFFLGRQLVGSRCANPKRSLFEGMHLSAAFGIQSSYWSKQTDFQVSYAACDGQGARVIDVVDGRTR